MKELYPIYNSDQNINQRNRSIIKIHSSLKKSREYLKFPIKESKEHDLWLLGT